MKSRTTTKNERYLSSKTCKKSRCRQNRQREKGTATAFVCNILEATTAEKTDYLKQSKKDNRTKVLFPEPTGKQQHIQTC